MNDLVDTCDGIGLIGIGAIGGAIAQHLLKAGMPLRLWARSKSKAITLLENGALWNENPSLLLQNAEVVITCVTDTEAIESVVLGPGGLAEGAGSRPKIIIDHSTIHPDKTRQIAQKVAQKGITWIDAPVTGGEQGAKNGDLLIMTGGNESAIEKVRPVLKLYSKKITRVGGNGSGQAAKVVNQMLIGGHVAVTAEALNFASNFGISATDLPSTLAGGWGDSTVLQNHGLRMANACYPDNVPASLMLKDIEIACDMGKLTQSPMPVTQKVQSMYRKLVNEGNDEKGQIGIMWLYRQTPTE